MSTEDLHLLTGAYVLDSLDDLERVAFERHLADCEDCRNEVHELRETVAQIGAAETTPPPSALRQSVFAEVARTAQLPPHVAPVTSQRTRRWTQCLAVAAVAVLAFGLGTVVTDRSVEQTVVAQEDQLTQIVSAPDAVMAPMKMKGDARSKVIVSPSQGKAVMVGAGIAAPKANTVYQVWLIDDTGVKHGMSTFEPNADGTAEMVVDADFSNIAAVAVTLEPVGGSKQPTSDPVGVAALGEQI